MVLVLLAAAGAALAISLAGRAVAAGGTTTARQAPPASLSDQKLQAEIAQLKAETKKLNSKQGFLSEYGAFLTALLTALAAIGGLSLAFRQQIKEQARQRDADRKQRRSELEQRKLDREREQEARDHEREQRELESTRRLEERFTAVLTELGSESEAVQAGAAVSLVTFLRPEQQSFHYQVRLVALANLKVAHPEPVRKILLHVFEQAARLAPLEANERDLSNAQLKGADLSYLDLAGADLHEAVLKNANLENVTLREARGKVDLTHARVCGKDADLHGVRFNRLEAPDVNFTEAKLTAAHLEGGNLQRAHFQQTRLQAAHLEGADLRGAQFQQADLRNTYFCDRDVIAGRPGITARLDDTALLTITKAQHWQQALLAPEHTQRAHELRPYSDRQGPGRR